MFTINRFNMRLLIDEEIILKGKDSGFPPTDLLNTMVYAESLQKTIMSADTSKKPFTIGLFGEWGSGKSSIIKTVRDNLEKNQDVEYGFVHYDAWKYSGDSFRRMFLLELQRQLGVKPSEKLQRFYDNINEDIEVKHVTNSRYLLFVIAVLIIIFLLILFGDEAGDRWKLTIATMITFITLLLNIKKNSTDDLKVTVQKSRLFAPEQFEECFDEIIDESRKSPSLTKRFLNWVLRVDNKYDKLVIIIDNIDRCHHEMAYTLLTDIKNYLGNKHSAIVFVVPVDVDALRKHVLTKHKTSTDQANKDADEFLRKFFNVSLWIKPYHTDEMFEYADALNKKYNLNFQPTTISIVANEFATNPRRIIQLFNNLTIEFQNYDEAFIREHQAVICQFTIIREEFPEFYKQVQRDASILFDLNNDILKKEDNSRLRLFMQRTYYISKQYEHNLSTVDIILSNSNTSASLTPQIRELVLIPGNIESILSFIDNDEDRRQDVATYVLTAIRKSINRGLIEADMVNLYPAYLYLFFNNLINESESKAFTNLMSSDELWDKLLPHITDYLSMHIQYAHKLLKHNNFQLKDSFVRYIDNLNTGVPYEEKVRNSIFFACNELGVYSVGLEDSFNKAYFEDPVSALAFRYPEANLVFTDKLVTEVIEQMKNENPLVENSPYNHFQSICSQIDPQKDNNLVLEFLKKLYTIIPEYDYELNNKGEMLPFMVYLNNLFSTCKNLTLSDVDSLQKCVSLFTNRIQMQGYAHGLLINNVEDSHLVSEFLKLFQNVSLCTNKPMISNEDIIDLITNDNWQNETISSLYILYKRHFDVSHYRASILAISEYGAKHLEMISYLMSDACPEVRRMNEDEINVEIRTMVDRMINDNKYDYSDFLVAVAESKYVEDIMINYLKTLSTVNLEKLPSKLQRYVVAKFEENIDSYTNTESILALIASCGSKSGIGKLARILNSKLSSGEENVVWDILPKLHYLKASDAKMLSTTIECLDIQDLSEEDKEKYINIISKFSK